MAADAHLDGLKYNIVCLHHGVGSFYDLLLTPPA